MTLYVALKIFSKAYGNPGSLCICLIYFHPYLVKLDLLVSAAGVGWRGCHIFQKSDTTLQQCWSGTVFLPLSSWKAGKVSHLLSVTAQRDPSLMPQVLAVFVLTLFREPLSRSSRHCFSCVSLAFVAASPSLKLQNPLLKMCDLWLWPLSVSEEGGEMMPERP